MRGVERRNLARFRIYWEKEREGDQMKRKYLYAYVVCRLWDEEKRANDEAGMKINEIWKIPFKPMIFFRGGCGKLFEWKRRRKFVNFGQYLKNSLISYLSNLSFIFHAWVNCLEDGVSFYALLERWFYFSHKCYSLKIPLKSINADMNMKRCDAKWSETKGFAISFRLMIVTLW